jgi:hypothetical protein
MVPFNKLYFTYDIDWSKGDHHAGCENTSLFLTYMKSASDTNFAENLGGAGSRG